MIVLFLQKLYASDVRFVTDGYLSPINFDKDFLGAVLLDLLFLRVSPSFSVTTHSFTLLASKRPINEALVRWNDITFSNNTQ